MRLGPFLDSRPVSGHGVTFFRGNDPTCVAAPKTSFTALDSRVRGKDVTRLNEFLLYQLDSRFRGNDPLASSGKTSQKRHEC